MSGIKISDSDFKEVESKENKIEEIEDYSDMITVKVVADEDVKYEDTIILTLSDRKGITALFDEKKRKVLAYFFDKSAGWDELRAKEWLRK